MFRSRGSARLVWLVVSLPACFPLAQGTTPDSGLPIAVSTWSRTIFEYASVQDIAVDGFGDVVVAGYFVQSVDLDPTDGLDYATSQGDYDVFVVKVHADGSYAWSRTFGCPDRDEGESVAANTYGDVFVVGAFRDTVDFDPTDGVDERTPIDDPGTATPDENCFLTKLHGDGSYAWTRTFGGGAGFSRAYGVAYDARGNLWIGGEFVGSVDFDPGIGNDIHSTVPRSRDVFVTKLDGDGNYLWTRTFGGSGAERGTGIAVDRQGNPFMTGTFRGTVDFDPTSGVDLHTRVSAIEDVFLTKLLADGSYGWTHTWPVAGVGQRLKVSVDDDGAALLAGLFNDTVDFDPSTEGVDLQTAPGDYNSAFVTKVRNDGTWAWSRTFLSSLQAEAIEATADSEGNVMVCGTFRGTTDFDPTDGVDLRTPSHGFTHNEAYLTKLTADGMPVWTRTIGPTDGAHAVGVVVDDGGATIITGWYGGVADFQFGCAVEEHVSVSPANFERFIIKLVCVTPSSDFDSDGDTDLRDAAKFQNCFSGEAPAACPGGCDALDLDADDDIDLDDYTVFRSGLVTP